MSTFPSLEWFQRLADRMEAQPEKYRRLGVVDLTLVVKIEFPAGRTERYCLTFETYRCSAVRRLADDEVVVGRHPVQIEGEYGAWKEMIDNIQRSGAADLTHTLNYLTLPDWPLRLVSLSDDDQLDVDRFYRYNESLQEFFNGAAAVETRFAA
jgi:hypothetical protein